MKFRRVLVLFFLSLYLLAIHTQAAQGPGTRTRTLEGVVSDSWFVNKGKVITVESGGVKYWFSLVDLSGDETVGGDVTEVGARVRVTYRNLTRSSDGTYEGTPLRVVRLPNSSSPKKTLRDDLTVTQSFESWPVFWQTFQRAVLRRDRTTVKSLMSQRFEWALDGHISRDQAFNYLDSMKVWPGLRNAVTRKPVVCAQYSCRNRSGYHVSSSPKYSTEIMFEKINGRWWWTAVLGD